MKAEDSNSSKPNILDTIKLSKALRLAKRKSKDGQLEEAKNIYQDILQKFSKNKTALSELQLLDGDATVEPQDPPSEQLQSIINLYTQGQLQQALSEATQMLEGFPNSVVLYNIAGACNAGLMQFDAAINSYEQAIKIKPDYAEAYYNMGIALQNKGDPEAAINSYKQAIKIKPDYAKAYSNMGNALKDKGDLEVAIDSYEQAIKIKPDYAEVYYNMGNALKEKGDPEAAIDSYKQAIKIKPDYVEAYYNMGNSLKDKVDLEAAIDSYKQAIKIKPDYALAYNNMGNALNDKGDPEAAIDSYEQALKIKPDLADAFWNLHGIEKTIQGAEYWIDKCLIADTTHLNAKLMKAALRFYQGDKNNFEELMQSELKQHPYMRSFSWAFSLPNLPELFFDKFYFFDAVVEKSIISKPFYEFGVWRASSFKYLIKAFKKGYGFDTFSGLPEDWHSENGSVAQKAGTYTSDGNVPKIKGGKFIVGKFEDTLPVFFSESRPIASVINFDADLYSSTICALNFSKSVMDKDTILIFDELIINESWEQDEFKALNEFCSINHYSYEVIAISFFTKQVAVKLIGI
jgi:tetratricopeptide (TPR) repeat protein